MELIKAEYLLRPKERTFEGVCEALEEAKKELKKAQSKKSTSNEEIAERVHRIKILELKRSKYERMSDEKRSRLSMGGIEERKDSTLMLIEKINEEIDDQTSSHIISDAVGLLGNSMDLNRFLSFFNDEEAEKDNGNALLISQVTLELEKTFKFGDELLAKLIVSHGFKSEDLDEFEELVSHISTQYQFTPELLSSLYQLISQEKNQEFVPKAIVESLHRLKDSLEAAILKISSAAEDKEKILTVVVEAVGEWGKLLEIVNQISSNLHQDSLQSDLDDLISKKKKLGKNIANLFSTISYIRASVGSWNMENATASLDEATKSVWKISSSLIDVALHCVQVLEEMGFTGKNRAVLMRGKGDQRKLTKFFGAEPPKKVDPLAHLIADEAFSTDLFFTMEGSIKGGSLERLVERITHHSIYDHDVVYAFLLTYRSFTDPKALLKLLISRYELEPPSGLDAAKTAYVMEKKFLPLRAQVLNVVKEWIKLDPELFGTDDDLKATLIEFSLTKVRSSTPAAAAQIDAVLNGTLVPQTTLRREEKPPVPIIPKSLRHLSICSIDPTEVARQLTLIDFDAFKKIRPKEFFKLAWSKKNSAELAPNITALIRRSTQLTSFVCATILDEPELKQRAEVLKHFILIADRCRSLNNFNSLMSIHGGLMSSSIHRLQRTWRLLGKREMQLLEELKELMSHRRNFGDYRAALKQAKSHCIPFLGLYLTDLTFIEDGNKDFLANGEFINFDKRLKAAKVIQEIQHFQSKPYNYQSVPQIQEFLGDLSQYEKGEEEFYEISQSVEKKETQGETFVRALSDSGLM